MEPYSRDSLAARRRLRRRVHLRRRIVAALAVLAFIVLGEVALTHLGGSAAPVAPAAFFGKRPAIFPRVAHSTAAVPFVSIGGKQGREVALTFDDGPGPYTAEVVRTLKRLHAPGPSSRSAGPSTTSPTRRRSRAASGS